MYHLKEQAQPFRSLSDDSAQQINDTINKIDNSGIVGMNLKPHSLFSNFNTSSITGNSMINSFLQFPTSSTPFAFPPPSSPFSMNFPYLGNSPNSQNNNNNNNNSSILNNNNNNNSSYYQQFLANNQQIQDMIPNHQNRNKNYDSSGDQQRKIQTQSPKAGGRPSKVLDPKDEFQIQNQLEPDFPSSVQEDQEDRKMKENLDLKHQQDSQTQPARFHFQHSGNTHHKDFQLNKKDRNYRQAGGQKGKFGTGKTALSKPCDNMQCKGGPNLVLVSIKSKVSDAVLDLCEKCAETHKKERYCDFCEQIYESDTDDGKQWIECSICQRWNHKDCELQHGNPDLVKNVNSSSTKYYCKKCRPPQQEEILSHDLYSNQGHSNCHPRIQTNQKVLKTIQKYVSKSPNQDVLETPRPAQHNRNIINSNVMYGKIETEEDKENLKNVHLQQEEEEFFQTGKFLRQKVKTDSQYSHVEIIIKESNITQYIKHYLPDEQIKQDMEALIQFIQLESQLTPEQKEKLLEFQDESGYGDADDDVETRYRFGRKGAEEKRGSGGFKNFKYLERTGNSALFGQNSNHNTRNTTNPSQYNFRNHNNHNNYYTSFAKMEYSNNNDSMENEHENDIHQKQDLYSIEGEKSQKSDIQDHHANNNHHNQSNSNFQKKLMNLKNQNKKQVGVQPSQVQKGQHQYVNKINQIHDNMDQNELAEEEIEQVKELSQQNNGTNNNFESDHEEDEEGDADANQELQQNNNINNNNSNNNNHIQIQIHSSIDPRESGDVDNKEEGCYNHNAHHSDQPLMISSHNENNKIDLSLDLNENDANNKYSNKRITRSQLNPAHSNELGVGIGVGNITQYGQTHNLNNANHNNHFNNNLNNHLNLMKRRGSKDEEIFNQLSTNIYNKDKQNVGSNYNKSSVDQSQITSQFIESSALNSSNQQQIEPCFSSAQSSHFKDNQIKNSAPNSSNKNLLQSNIQVNLRDALNNVGISTRTRNSIHINTSNQSMSPKSSSSGGNNSVNLSINQNPNHRGDDSQNYSRDDSNKRVLRSNQVQK